MTHAHKVDADGSIVELYRYKEIEGDPEHILVLTGLSNGEEVWETLASKDFVLVDLPSGFYEPRWVDGAWVEGLTDEEIAAKRAAQDAPSPTIEEVQQENEILRQRLEQIETMLGISGKGN